MARLEDKQNRGLPPPPAATRRSANPWKFSETGRKPEPRPEPIGHQLLEELMQRAPAEEGPAHEAPAHEGPAHEGPAHEGPAHEGSAHEGSAHEAPAHVEASPPAAASQARPGLWFLVIAVVVILVALRIFSEARVHSDWAKLIGPLVLIAFIAHGWWRAYQRREAKKTRLN